MKLFELIKDLKENRIFIPKGTILFESQWLSIIGREGGNIDLKYQSDREFWKEVYRREPDYSEFYDEHIKVLNIVKFNTSQKEFLIGSGIIVKKTYDGTIFRIGDYISITEPEFQVRYTSDNMVRIHPEKEYKGILTLILNQGICLINNNIWMQLSLSNSNVDQWKILSKYEDIRNY